MRFFKNGFLLLEVVFYLAFVVCLASLTAALLGRVYSSCFSLVDRSNNFCQTLLALDRIGHDVMSSAAHIHSTSLRYAQDERPAHGEPVEPFERAKSVIFETPKFKVGWILESKNLFRIQDDKKSMKSLVLKDVDQFKSKIIKSKNKRGVVSILLETQNLKLEGCFAPRIGELF